MQLSALVSMAFGFDVSVFSERAIERAIIVGFTDARLLFTANGMGWR